MNDPIKKIFVKSLASAKAKSVDIKPGDQLADVLSALGVESELTRVEHKKKPVKDIDDLYALLDEGDELSTSPHMDAGR